MTGDIQTRQLEYLVALARERHFARAAAACQVSQPALSTAIRTLELNLGITIVNRRQRFAGFTPEGQRLVGWAHRFLSGQDELHQELTRMREGLRATLRIGVIPAAVAATPFLTSSFSANHELPRIRIEVVSSRAIERNLADVELDVGLTYLTKPGPAGTRSISLYQERYLLLTSADGEYGRRDSVTWSEAATQSICALTAEQQDRLAFDAMLAAARGAQRGPVLEVDTVDAIYAHVATHRWSSIIAHTWLHGLGLPAGTRAVALSEPSPHPTVGLLIADREPRSTVAGALVEALVEVDVSGALDTSLAQLQET